MQVSAALRNYGPLLADSMRRFPSRCQGRAGGSVPGSPCGEPARLRFPALTKWHAADVRLLAMVTVTGAPRRCGGVDEAGGGAWGGGGGGWGGGARRGG